MLTASLILAAVAASATAVTYGTDAFCALVWCPSLARLDDTTLTRSAGAVHRYGDARLPPIGATSIAAATTSAITAALAGHLAGTALAGAAVAALLAWLAVYLTAPHPPASSNASPRHTPLHTDSRRSSVHFADQNERA